MLKFNNGEIMTKKQYVPALRFEFLTRFYDPLVHYTTRETAFKSALLKQANLKNGQKILDLACGTGTLAVAVKRKCPQTEVFASDIDGEILQLARNKAKNARVKINFEQGFSDALPFADNSFDRVFSTLFFHHLTLERKNATLREILRVLKPNGEFHLADFALPRNKSQFILSKWIRIVDGYDTTRDNLRGRLMFLMSQNGFEKVERTKYFKTILGTIRLFKAVKLSEPSAVADG